MANEPDRCDHPDKPSHTIVESSTVTWCVGCRWLPRVVDDQELATQLRDFARRLREFHVVFSGLGFVVDGPQRQQIQIERLEDDTSVERVRDLISAARQGSLTSILLWNGRHQPGQECWVHIQVQENEISGVAITDFPLAACDGSAILTPFIRAFAADEAECYSIDGVHLRHWFLWLREGVVLPGLSNARLETQSDAPSIVTTLMNGTLYTWPENKLK